MNKLFALILVMALLFIGVVKPAYSLPAYEVDTTYTNERSFPATGEDLLPNVINPWK